MTETQTVPAPPLTPRLGHFSEGPRPPEPVLRRLLRTPAVASDLHGRLLFASERFQALVGFECGSVLGRPCPHPWWPPEDGERLTHQGIFISSPEAVRVALHSVRVRLRRADESRFLAVIRCERLASADGRPLGYGATITDVLSPNGSVDAEGERLELLERVSRAARDISDAVDRIGFVSGVGSALPEGLARLPELDTLSEREREVCLALLEGRRAPEIAVRLGISRHTVRNHVHAVFLKLGVHSQLELIRKLRIARA